MLMVVIDLKHIEAVIRLYETEKSGEPLNMSIADAVIAQINAKKYIIALASVENKELTDSLIPLDATLTKT